MLEPGVQGVVHEGSEDFRRQRIVARVDGLVQRVVKCLPLDAAVDQMAAAFMQQRLPPPPALGPAARDLPLHAGLPGKTLPAEVDGMLVQLTAPNLARLVLEDEGAVVYHCLANQRHSHASGEASDERGQSPESNVDGDGDAAEGESGSTGEPADAGLYAHASCHRLVFCIEMAPILEQLLAAPARFAPGATTTSKDKLRLRDVDLEDVCGAARQHLREAAIRLCKAGILIMSRPSRKRKA